MGFLNILPMALEMFVDARNVGIKSFEFKRGFI